MTRDHPRPAALFPRPPEAAVAVAREPVEGTECEHCGGAHIERYPVLQIRGWKLITRCQECLAVLRSEDAPTPFGFTYLPYGSYLRRRQQTPVGHLLRWLVCIERSPEDLGDFVVSLGDGVVERSDLIMLRPQLQIDAAGHQDQHGIDVTA